MERAYVRRLIAPLCMVQTQPACYENTQTCSLLHHLNSIIIFFNSHSDAFISSWYGFAAFSFFPGSKRHIPFVLSVCSFQPITAASLETIGPPSLEEKDSSSHCLSSSNSFLLVILCAPSNFVFQPPKMVLGRIMERLHWRYPLT